MALNTHTLDALRDGHYTLLLGAGASLGALSRDGRQLPTSSTFAQELVRGLALDVAPETPLAYVWDAAVHKCGSEEAVRKRFCVPRFLGCKPAAYHDLIPTFAWKRIYTFNVDDVLPASYEKGSEPLQSLLPLHFDDDYKEADPISDECQIVYLHGSELFPDRTLVFGPPAYAAAVTRQHTWWHVFASSFLCEPCIVIGASLREPDFETYLAWKRRPLLPLAAPSLYVSPRIDDAARAICERLGLTPIQMSAEEFLKDLHATAGDREKLSVRRARSVRGLSLLSTIKTIPALATLAREFVIVNDEANWPSFDRPPERFFEGYTPTWDDLRELRDVQLHVSAKIVADSRAFFESSIPTKPIALLCIEGTAGSGKTTALMRAAKGIADIGIDTLFFLGHSRLPFAVLSDIARRLPPSSRFVVAVDDVDTQVYQLRRFIETYPSAQARCVVMCAVRSGRHHFVDQNLFDLLEPQFEPLGLLTRREASDLAEKLRAAAKLGSFAGWTTAQLENQFVSTRGTGWGGQILTILLKVVQGGVLKERLISEWKSLDDFDVRTFYGAVCIAAACGIPVRLPVAFRAIETGDVNKIFTELSTGSMRSLMEWFDLQFVRPRHRVIGEETVRCMGLDELFRISQRLTLALAPYVNRQTIIGRTSEARLAKELMDTDGILVPVLGEHAEEWFATLESEWGWNSRYWEQRALTAMKAGHYSRARDFSEQAVGIEGHPLPMTTSANVMLTSIEHDETLERSQCEDLFFRSIERLDDAIRKSWEKHFISFHSYHILFLHAVRVARKLTGGIPDTLRIKLEFHGAEAGRLFGNDTDMSKALARLKTEDGLIWREN